MFISVMYVYTFESMQHIRNDNKGYVEEGAGGHGLEGGVY